MVVSSGLAADIDGVACFITDVLKLTLHVFTPLTRCTTAARRSLPHLSAKQDPSVQQSEFDPAEQWIPSGFSLRLVVL
jgi:hypothetical protein